MSEHIVDIDQSNAQQLLIEESQERPVLVDFWADWCEPCKTLMPILEKLVQEYGGQFLLARVNAEEQQMIAGQLGVRSLPTVMLIKDGQPVDGFTGAQPESAVRAMLEEHLPKPWDEMLQRARALGDEQRWSEALPLLREAHRQSGERSDIGIVLANAYLELNRLTEAETLLDAIPLADQDSDYQRARAQLELKQEAGKSPELEALEQAYRDNPQDLDTAYQLALQYHQDGHHREGLELLHDILQRDLNFRDGDAKKRFMDMLASLGQGDPLAVEYQRKFFTLMY